MPELLGLSYLTKDDILKFHLFACKIHDVLVFSIPFIDGTSGLFPLFQISDYYE